MRVYLEMLKKGKIEQFNDERPFKLDLFAEDLSGLDLQGVDLSNINLEKADLSRCNLSQANLSKTRLSGADLTEANLHAANLTRANLDEVYAGQTDLTEATLNQASMNDAEFPEANLQNAQLREIRGKNVDFSQACLKEASLVKAKLSGLIANNASFQYAELDGIRMAKSQLKTCDFQYASMASSLFAQASVEKCNFNYCNLHRSNWDQAILAENSFEQSNLSRSDLSGVDIRKMNLSTADTSEIHADLNQITHPPAVAAPHMFVEMPHIAVSNQKMLCCWINQEMPKPHIRYILVDIETGKYGDISALPTPTDLLRGLHVIDTPKGFVVLCFEDRPSGLYAVFYLINELGQQKRFAQFVLNYSTDFRNSTPFPHFRLRAHKSFLELYIISRNNPKIHIHQLKYTGENNHIYHDMPTVNGLIGNQKILAMTKGGTLVELSANGIERMLEPPAGFPGHRFDVDVVRDKIYLTWIDNGGGTSIPKKGVFAAQLNNKKDVLRFHPKSSVQSTCIHHDNDENWIAYTLAPVGFEPTDIWVAQLNGVANYPINTQDLPDEVDQIYLRKCGDSTLLIINLIDGGLCLYKLGDEQASRCSNIH